MTVTRPQFSLRTLLLAVVCCALGAWGVRTYRLSKMYKLHPQLEVTKWVIVGSDSKNRSKQKQIEYLYRVEQGKAERFIDCEPFGSVDEVTVTSRGRISHFYSAHHPLVDSVSGRQISNATRNRFVVIESIAGKRCNLEHIQWRLSEGTAWDPSPTMKTSEVLLLSSAEVKEIQGGRARKRVAGDPER